MNDSFRSNRTTHEADILKFRTVLSKRFHRLICDLRKSQEESWSRWHYSEFKDLAVAISLCLTLHHEYFPSQWIIWLCTQTCCNNSCGVFFKSSIDPSSPLSPHVCLLLHRKCLRDVNTIYLHFFISPYLYTQIINI